MDSNKIAKYKKKNPLDSVDTGTYNKKHNLLASKENRILQIWIMSIEITHSCNKFDVYVLNFSYMDPDHDPWHYHIVKK